MVLVAEINEAGNQILNVLRVHLVFHLICRSVGTERTLQTLWSEHHRRGMGGISRCIIQCRRRRTLHQRRATVYYPVKSTRSPCTKSKRFRRPARVIQFESFPGGDMQTAALVERCPHFDLGTGLLLVALV